MSSGPAIAIVHYHLRGGGVTRVIQQACRGLQSAGASVVVLVGERPDHEEPDINVQVVEGLEYDSRSDASTVLGRLRIAATESLGQKVDLWHIHNHCLGKNLTVPRLVSLLADEGEMMLLQPHDFAEDGRPELYNRLLTELGQGDAENLGRKLYPSGDHIHYGVINLRDAEFLATAGLDRSNVHYIPNSACLDLDSGEDVNIFPGLNLYLYPARPIRRKNIGELLMYAAVSEGNDVYGITLEPKNPFELPVYNQWKQFARKMDLPVHFNMAAKYSFDSLYRRADAIVTTSISEGFGLAFLEPWLKGKPLVGRDLPEVTGGLKQMGLDLDGLYSRTEVPVEWIGRAGYIETLCSEYIKYMDACGQKHSRSDLDSVVDTAIINEMVDFGCLNETMQVAVINRLCSTPDMRRALQPRTLAAESGHEERTVSNCRCVQQNFSAESYIDRLGVIYSRVLSSRVGNRGYLNGRSLLDSFLNPRRFSLLKALR